MQSNITEQDFWLDKPLAMGWRGWSLLIPACASGIGFFCFGVLGLSFTELAVLPGAFKTTLVLVGSFALIAGTELGTVSTVVEIYRKGAHLSNWDRVSLIVSLCATVGAFVMSFAALLGVSTSWGMVVQEYGPIVLGILAGLDSYGGFMEFGLYLNGYDARMKHYIDQLAEFKRDMLIAQQNSTEPARKFETPVQIIDIPTRDEPEPARIAITKREFREIAARMNGEIAVLALNLRQPNANRVDVFNDFLEVRGYTRKAPSTARDWIALILEE